MEMARIKVLSCSFLVSMEDADPAAGGKDQGSVRVHVLLQTFKEN